jgi:hypothetical protein
VNENRPRITIISDEIAKEMLFVLRDRVREVETENEHLRRALGCHIQADSYRETFPDSAEDAAGLRKSETWWRLMARCAVSLDSELADACGRAALAIPEVVAEIEKAFAAARTELKEPRQP